MDRDSTTLTESLPPCRKKRGQTFNETVQRHLGQSQNFQKKPEFGSELLLYVLLDYGCIGVSFSLPTVGLSCCSQISVIHHPEVFGHLWWETQGNTFHRLRSDSVGWSHASPAQCSPMRGPHSTRFCCDTLILIWGIPTATHTKRWASHLCIQ